LPVLKHYTNILIGDYQTGQGPLLEPGISGIRGQTASTAPRRSVQLGHDADWTEAGHSEQKHPVATSEQKHPVATNESKHPEVTSEEKHPVATSEP
jgi:hypothetical protein